MYQQDDKLIATHLGDDYAQFLNAVVPPVFHTSLHVFPTMKDYLNSDKYKNYYYGRCSNPTVRVTEQKIAAMERGKHAALFASGMAAATAAIFVTCKTGSHIVCLKNCYGPVATLLDEYCVPRLGMEVTYVDATAEAVEAAVRPNTHLIILESPTSLVFEVVDIRRISAMAREKGIKTYIDNTYCTPLYQKPLEMGIDIVMHTLSKYLGGHSDLIGGVLACGDDALAKAIVDCREWFGAIMQPQEAWLVTRGIRTLDVRLERHQKTAMVVASFLDSHPGVRKVNYPGLPSHPQHELAKAQQTGNCGLLSFEIRGTKEEALQVCDRLQLFQIAVSWGGFESLVCMPMYKTAPERVAWHGSADNLIRIHCGLEGTENLIADLEQALG